MCTQRFRDDDKGMVTVETAYGIAALFVIFLVCLGGLAVGVQHIQIADAAHMVAREVARGTPAATAQQLLPSTMQASITTSDSTVTVEIRQAAQLLPLTLTGRSEMPLEKIATTNVD